MEETLGKRIVFHRKRLSLTQDSLAEQLGVTAQAVSKWENDQSCPDITILPKLAEIFETTTDELLGIAKKEVHPPQIIPEEPENATAGVSSEKEKKWNALLSPGAPFGFWLFLTGLVALVDAVRLLPYDLIDIGLADIAISCGIFSFGLFSCLRQFSLLRLGCAIGGGIFVFNLLTEPSIGAIDWYVPLLAGLSLLGLDLLIQTIRKPKQNGMIVGNLGHMVNDSAKNHCTYDGEHFDCATRFGGSSHLITLPRLSSGKACVSFGELEVDLTDCKEFAPGCTLELNCTFGKLCLIVPKCARIEPNISTAFAALETKGSPAADAGSVIYVNGSASFGEITLRYI